MLEGVFIKVTIYNTPEKPMKYPPFNNMPKEIRGEDWASFLTRYGIQHLDKKSKMKESDEVNPDPFMQHCTFFAPCAFAQKAVEMFPKEVEILDEAAAEAFHNDRAHAHEEEQKIDNETLKYLREKYEFTGDVTLADQKDWDEIDKKAVDPEDPQPGIVKNKNKLFADFKAANSLSIVKPADVEAKAVAELAAAKAAVK